MSEHQNEPSQQSYAPPAAGQGYVPQQGGSHTVVVLRRRPNHVLHLILTVLTFGMWSSVWIVLTARYWGVDDYRDPTVRKGMNRRTWITVGVLFAVGIVSSIGLAALTSKAVDSVNTANDSTTTPDSGDGGDSAEAGEDSKAAGIGDQVRDGKFQFTVTDVKSGVRHVGDKDFGTDAQGEFVIVSVTVENIGDEAQTLDSSVQSAYDDGGREFSADGEEGISLDSKAFLEAINPGNSVKAKLVFDVPKGTGLTRLELHDSAFSGGVAVDLR